MMNMIRQVYILFFAVLLFAACESEEDAFRAVSPPSIRVDFIPWTSKQITDSIYTKLDSIKTNLGLRLDSIRNGEGTEMPDDTLRINDSLLMIETHLHVVDTFFTNFRGGRVPLSMLKAVDGDFAGQYQDTALSVFFLPLNINGNASTFIFEYETFTGSVEYRVDTIEFTYNKHVVSEFERVFVIADFLEVPYHTFDSLTRHFCLEENCLSSEITYQVYF